MSDAEEIHGDALSGGGVFHPELEIQAPEESDDEKAEREKYEREARELEILTNSPAWNRIKQEFLEEIEKMKYEMAKMASNQSSLEQIGQEFKIGQICSQRLSSFILRAEKGKGSTDE